MDLKKLKEKTVDINVGEILNEQKYSLKEKQHVVIFSNLIHLKCYFTLKLSLQITKLQMNSFCFL